MSEEGINAYPRQIVGRGQEVVAASTVASIVVLWPWPRRPRQQQRRRRRPVVPLASRLIVIVWPPTFTPHSTITFTDK